MSLATSDVIIKIIKSLEESGLLIKGVIQTIEQLKMKQKNKKEDFFLF